MNRNKTGTSQVGAISKAQIKSNGGPFGDKKISRKSRTVPKRPKGGSFTFIRFRRLRLKSKKPKWDPLETKQFWKKKSHSAEKKLKGDPLVPSGFVRYV